MGRAIIGKPFSISKKTSFLFKFRSLFLAGFVHECCYYKALIQEPDKPAVFTGSWYKITLSIRLKVAVFEAFLNLLPADFNPLFDLIDNLRIHFEMICTNVE